MIKITRPRQVLFHAHPDVLRSLGQATQDAVQRLLCLSCGLALIACSNSSVDTLRKEAGESSLSKHRNGMDLKDLPETCKRFLQQEHEQLANHGVLDPKTKKGLQRSWEAKKFALNRIKSNPGSRAELSHFCSSLQTQGQEL